MIWSCLAYAAVRVLKPKWGAVAASGVAFAVFSHFPADVIAHIPDVPLYDDTWKAGLGLWRSAWGTYVVEGALLVGTMIFFLRHSDDVHWRWWVVATALLIANAVNIYGPPPANITTMCVQGEVSYFVIAAAALWAASKANAETQSSH